jgi:general secretion pathway protein L
MPTLFIRVLAPANQDAEGYELPNEWLIAEDDGSTRAKGVTDARGLGELIDPGTEWVKNPQNVVVVLPGEHVLAVTCAVPGRSVGQIRRALPFVVEEFVATDIEGMQLAAGIIRKGESVRCNLIDRELLNDWLACLNELGLNPGTVISEAELLPCGPDQVSVLFDGDAVLVKTADQAATVDRPNLLLALGSVTAHEVLLLNGTLTDIELGQLDGDMSVVQESVDAGVSTLAYLASRWRDQSDIINLLQGAYAPKKASNVHWLQWRSVAGIAAIWLLVGFVSMIAQGFWASARADSLQAQSEELYRSIFPKERRITNVRRQMRSKLGANTAVPGAMGFTDYLGELSVVLDKNVVVSSLNYTEARGELAADLLLRGYQELDGLKDSLNQRGVNVVITSAEQQDSGVRARIRLGG